MSADRTDVPGYLGRVVTGDGVPAGTCFQVAAGVIVTAWHVLDNLGAGEAGATVAVDTLRPGSNTQPAQVARVDSVHDLAVLRVIRPFAASLSAAADSDLVAAGARVRVLGVARLDDRDHDYRYAPAAGTWSGPAMRDDHRLAVMDAKAVVPGMSGAPVRRTSDDRLVGVISGRYNSADGWFRDSVLLARVEDLLPLLQGLAAIPADGHIQGDAAKLPVPVGRAAVATVVVFIAIIMAIVLAVVGVPRVIHWFSESGSSSIPSTPSSSGPPGLIATVSESDGASTTSTSAAFSPDGKTLATADDNTDMTYLWNAANGDYIVTLPHSASTGDNNAVASVAFSSDDTTLAAGDSDGNIYVWNFAQRYRVTTVTDPSTDSIGSPFGVSLVDYSHGGTMLAAADGDTVDVWKVADYGIIATLPDPSGNSIDAIAFSPDDRTVVAGDQDGTIYVWQVGNPNPIATLTDPSSDGINSLAFSPDGTLAAGDGNDTTYLWNIADPHPIAALTDPDDDNTQPGVSCIAFSPDGKTLAVAAGFSNITYLWNVDRQRITDTLNGSGPVAFSPNGKVLINSNGSDGISVWNIAEAETPWSASAGL